LFRFFFYLLLLLLCWRPPWRPDYWASRLAPTRLDRSGVFNKINGMRLQKFSFFFFFFFFYFFREIRQRQPKVQSRLILYLCHLRLCLMGRQTFL
jgi:hypothetical protein